jgi:transaldolase
MGMTSNPTIFEKALSEGTAYDEQIAADAAGHSPAELFELIETDDVRAACDHFAGVFQRPRGGGREGAGGGGGDGFVSIEVSPGLAHDADGTIIEGRRLWRTVARPNVMVKVPGTTEGMRAIRTLTADGINVNITLLFAVGAYRQVIDAFQAGLEDRIAANQPIDGISSVASFFVSRVDSETDRRLEAIGTPAAQALRGKAAIANAKLAYRLFQESIAAPRWKALASKGARVQRPLWASTSTKNPAYRDVRYVEDLIGPHTVNTMPPATIEAFRDHGVVARTVDQELAAAERVFTDLAALGIDIDEVTAKLLVDGVASFSRSFSSLLGGLERKTAALVGAR